MAVANMGCNAALPPSALPGISPTGGEIGKRPDHGSHRHVAVRQAPHSIQSPPLWGRCPAGQRGVLTTTRAAQEPPR